MFDKYETLKSVLYEQSLDKAKKLLAGVAWKESIKSLEWRICLFEFVGMEEEYKTGIWRFCK